MDEFRRKIFKEKLFSFHRNTYLCRLNGKGHTAKMYSFDQNKYTFNNILVKLMNKFYSRLLILIALVGLTPPLYSCCK